MIKCRYETKTYTKTEKVLVSEKMYCDVCGKEIKKGKPFYRVETGHCDWGNDSCDSRQHYDICGPECLGEMFDRYVKRSHDGRTIANTEYIEIEHDNARVKGDINYEM